MGAQELKDALRRRRRARRRGADEQLRRGRQALQGPVKMKWRRKKAATRVLRIAEYRRCWETACCVGAFPSPTCLRDGSATVRRGQSGSRTRLEASEELWNKNRSRIAAAALPIWASNRGQPIISPPDPPTLILVQNLEVRDLELCVPASRHLTKCHGDCFHRCLPFMG